MSFPRYPKYKDSGVEWLGEVPEHWAAVPLKRLCNTITDGAHISPETENGIYSFISTKDIVGESIDFENCLRTSESSFDYMVKTGCRPHAWDVLFSKDGTIGKTVVCREDRDFAVASSLIIIRPMECALDSSFLNYLCQSSFVANQVDIFVKGAGLPRLSLQNLRKVIASVPPIMEQNAIARFLDRETAKIDALVAEQRRLIELLKEKRQAVVSHAVTKGLNPHAAMKPSRIEWLGEVPEHWGVTPLKYLVKLRGGGTPSKANLAYWDGDVPWASSKDLKSESLSDTEDHITRKALDEGAAELVAAGSLLIVVRGMILIHTFPVVKALIPMAINQDLKALTPTEALDVDYLAWLLRGAAGETFGRIDEAAHGTKVLRLESWTSIFLPVPPREEQRMIVAGLLDRLSRLDALTAEAQRAIDLLQERRTALISAAVTGKIDVRKLAEGAAA